MTTATQNDTSDLLILSDDDNTNTLIIDDTIEEQNNSSVDDLISFDDVKEIENNSNSNFITESSSDFNIFEDNDSNLDFGSDLSIKEESNIEETPAKESDNFDFGDFAHENTDTLLEEIAQPDTNVSTSFDLIEDNNSSFVSELATIGTMSDILDEAMNKFSARSEVISNERNIEETHISNLKEQISNLEAEVSVAEVKVSELNAEQALILKNTKALEKMKSDNTTSDLLTETSVKIHNLKRKQAA